MDNYSRKLVKQPRFIVFTIILYIYKNFKKNPMSKLNTFLTGSVGTAAIEGVNHIPLPEIDPSHNTASLIIQIVLALATLFKMFKKDKKTV
jgi:hypothetical protein